MALLQHFQHGHASLSQAHLLGIFDAFRFFKHNCFFNGSHGIGNLRRKQNAFGLICFVHDAKKPFGIRLKHDEITRHFGFEFVNHSSFQEDWFSERSNS